MDQFFDEKKQRPADYDAAWAAARQEETALTQQAAQMDEEATKRQTAMRGAGLALVSAFDAYAGGAGDAGAMRSVQIAAQRFADQYADYYYGISAGVRANVMLDRNGDFHVKLSTKEDGFPLRFDYGQMEASLRKLGYLDTPKPEQGPPDMTDAKGNVINPFDWGVGKGVETRRAAARHYGWGEKFFGGDQAALDKWIDEGAGVGSKGDPMAGYYDAMEHNNKVGALIWRDRAVASGFLSKEEGERYGREIYAEGWGQRPSGSSRSSSGAPGAAGEVGAVGGEAGGGQSGQTGGAYSASDGSSAQAGTKETEGAAVNPIGSAGAEPGKEPGKEPNVQKSMDDLRAEAAAAGNYEVEDMEWDRKKGKFVPKQEATPWNVKGVEGILTRVNHPDNKTVEFSVSKRTKSGGKTFNPSRGWVDTDDSRDGVGTAHEILSRLGYEPNSDGSYIMTNEQYDQVLKVLRSGRMPPKPQASEPPAAPEPPAPAEPKEQPPEGNSPAEPPAADPLAEPAEDKSSAPASEAEPESAEPAEQGKPAPVMVGGKNLSDPAQLKEFEQKMQQQGYRVREIDGEKYLWHPKAKVWIGSDGNTMTSEGGIYREDRSGKLRWNTDRTLLGNGSLGETTKRSVKFDHEESIPKDILAYLRFKNGQTEDEASEGTDVKEGLSSRSEGRLAAFSDSREDKVRKVKSMLSDYLHRMDSVTIGAGDRELGGVVARTAPEREKVVAETLADGKDDKDLRKAQRDAHEKFRKDLVSMYDRMTPEEWAEAVDDMPKFEKDLASDIVRAEESHRIARNAAAVLDMGKGDGLEHGRAVGVRSRAESDSTGSSNKVSIRPASDGELYDAYHNHPKSSIFSTDDLRNALRDENRRSSTIAMPLRDDDGKLAMATATVSWSRNLPEKERSRIEQFLNKDYSGPYLKDGKLNKYFWKKMFEWETKGYVTFEIKNPTRKPSPAKVDSGVSARDVRRAGAKGAKVRRTQENA